MKTKNIYQSIGGQVYRTEKEAREYYGDRFEGMLKNNLLFKFIVDEEFNVIGEW